MATIVRAQRTTGALKPPNRGEECAPRLSLESTVSRVAARGKFLHINGKKFYMRGVTYGPFRPDAAGCEYKSEPEVERDFALMAANGVNTVRTYTAVPRWLLDCAQRHGLRVLVGIGWEQHITFLDRSETRRGIEKRVRDAVRTSAGHPAVLGYAIGNEIPASIVRWYGATKIERFIASLYRIAKSEDPDALVTYVNYPTTEYLHLPFVDFFCFNVYLESRKSLEFYLARLQNIAGNKPVVLGELGFDSERNGADKQAEVLEWQVRTAFAGGAAGVCIFSWTDEWFRGGHDIDNWGFGLTDRNRQPKQALAVVARAFGEVPFPGSVHWPKVSIVVCTYNGARHIREVCDSLSQLDYPDYEVIIVSDGSTDNTLQIVREYPYKLIAVENGGLSRARNTGWQAASGEFVAYLDDDAYPDTHWLKYMVWTFLNSDHEGMGGPNIPPPEDGFIANCVAHSPGGPNHVLLDDQLAEHIPGCCMAFRRSTLERVGGFDPTFRIAGDDVDLCWRIQQQSGTLGFSPAAMVWHHRRSTVRAYLRQQYNYGRAEAMLAEKWPTKYNTAGHVSWQGRLYGTGRTTPMFSKRVVFQGTWGTAPFQSMYETPGGLISGLLLMPEWHLLVLFLVAVSLLGLVWKPLLLALIPLVPALLAPIAQAIRSSIDAPLEHEPSFWRRFASRAVIAMLHVRQPFNRLQGRLSEGLHPWPKHRHGFSPLLFKTHSQWHEKWASAESRLEKLEQRLHALGANTRRGGGFDRWDIEIRGGTLGAARVLMAIEEHGSGRQLVRYRLSPRFSIPARAVLLVGVVLTSLAIGPGDRTLVGFMLLFLALIAGRAMLECAAAAKLLKKASEPELGRES